MEKAEVNSVNKDQLIDIIGEICSLFHQVIPIENTILLTDTEIVRGYYLGSEAVVQKLDFIGKPIPTNGNIPTVLKTGAQKYGIIPKELYGVPFKASTIAIKDDKEVIGTITLALSLKNQNALQEATDNISSTAEQLSATTEELASSAMLLSGNVQEVLVHTQDILEMIEQTNSILDFVNSVATNSRLLGINAAIEAARAGEFGKGFSVVADEIRKMAESSARSVSDTKKLIASIDSEINHLVQKVGELTDVAHTQAAANQEMTATIQNFATSIHTMQKLSEII